MSKKRQTAIYDSRGKPSAQLTTLSYDYADGHVVPAHFHKEDQLVFASRGVMTIRTQDGIWVVPPLRAVWIPAQAVHSISMSGAVLMRTLYFVPRMTREIQRRCFVLNVSPLLRELIVYANTRREWKTRVAQDRRIVEVLLDQLRVAPSVPLQLPQVKDSRASRVVDLLVNEPGDSRPLSELCKDCGGSKRTIERAFIDETGMTFGKWRQQLRLLHAMRLLASGEKVTTAALESGYNSPSAFIAAFKKTLGQTPSQYV